MPIYLALLAWIASTAILIVLCRILIPQFPAWILVVFGLFWSPLNSYISARLHGMTGRGVAFPYIKEASVVAVGYQRVDVWYAPIPLPDHGPATQRFKEFTLTGCKLTSILKAEAFMFPLVLIASFLSWAYFWKVNPVPSAQFPYAQRFWPVDATMQAVLQQINVPRTGEEQNWFLAAIKPSLIVVGTIGGLIAAGLFSLLKLPTLFFYGFAGGIAQYPAITLPQLLGAWIGKRYMRRRYGAENWVRYAPVLLAGFSCGTGLASMASIAVALAVKAVAQLPY